MALWADFFPLLMPSVMGCTASLAEQELRLSACEFFERTRAWRQWLEPLQAVAGWRDYDFELPTGTSLVRMERIAVNGNMLTVLSPNTSRPPGSSQQEQLGAMTADMLTVTITQPMTAGDRIDIEATLMPSRTAKGVPDNLFEQYRSEIVSGAKARLMLMPDLPFTNPALASVARQEFESAVATRTVQAWQGMTGQTPRRARTLWA